MVTRFSILAWKIPWTEEPGGPQWGHKALDTVDINNKYWILFRTLLDLTQFPCYHLLFQFSSVAKLWPTLCDPMNCSTPDLPVHHQLLDSTQTHVHWVGDAIQPSHPPSSPSPSAFNLSQHQGLFQWVSSSHQVAKALEFQLQHKTLVVYRFIKLCIYSYIHFPWKWVTSLELKGTYSKVKGKLLVTMWSWQ